MQSDLNSLCTKYVLKVSGDDQHQYAHINRQINKRSMRKHGGLVKPRTALFSKQLFYPHSEVQINLVTCVFCFLNEKSWN